MTQEDKVTQVSTDTKVDEILDSISTSTENAKRDASDEWSKISDSAIKLGEEITEASNEFANRVDKAADLLVHGEPVPEPTIAEQFTKDVSELSTSVSETVSGWMASGEDNKKSTEENCSSTSQTASAKETCASRQVMASV